MLNRRYIAAISIACAAVMLFGVALGTIPSMVSGAEPSPGAVDTYESFMAETPSNLAISGSLDMTLTMPMAGDAEGITYAVPVSISAGFESRIFDLDAYETISMSMSLLDYSSSYDTESYVWHYGDADLPAAVHTYTHIRSDGAESYGRWSVRDMRDTMIDVPAFLAACVPVVDMSAVDGETILTPVDPGRVLESVAFRGYLESVLGEAIDLDGDAYDAAVAGSEATCAYDKSTGRISSVKLSGFSMSTDEFGLSLTLDVAVSGYGTVDADSVHVPDSVVAAAEYATDGVFISEPDTDARENSTVVDTEVEDLDEEGIAEKFGPLMVDPETGLPVGYEGDY